MADTGAPGDRPTDEGPSLEMPSLPFGRKKRRGRDDGDVEPPTAPVAEPEATVDVEPVRQHVPEAAPEPEPVPEAAAVPEPAPVPDPEPSHRPPVEAVATSTSVRAVPAAPAAPAPPSRPAAPSAPAAPSGPSGRGRRVPALPPLPALPALGGPVAALATGAVVGAVGVLLVWLASLGCEAARGTASCGDGPGFWVLVAILAVLAYLGTVLLRAFGTADAGSTSLLAVGLMAVLLLVLFSDSLTERWMVLAVPVVSAAAYALSWWLSTRAVEPTEGGPPDRL